MQWFVPFVRWYLKKSWWWETFVIFRWCCTDYWFFSLTKHQITFPWNEEFARCGNTDVMKYRCFGWIPMAFLWIKFTQASSLVYLIICIFNFFVLLRFSAVFEPCVPSSVQRIMLHFLFIYLFYFSFGGDVFLKRSIPPECQTFIERIQD